MVTEIETDPPKPSSHPSPLVIHQLIKEFIKCESDLYSELKDFYENFGPLHDELPEECNLKHLIEFLGRYYLMSEKIHKGLISCDFSLLKIEEFFTELKDELYDIYRTYIMLYATYLSDLNMIQNDGKLNSIMMSCKNNTKAKHDVKVSLQKPFQRLTKYSLFFEPALKDKKMSDEGDRETIKRIVAFFKEILREINLIQKEINSNRIRENILSELQGTAAPISADDTGPLLKCGNVLDGNNKMRFLIAFQRLVLVCKNIPDGKYELRNFFLCNDLTVDIGKKHPNSLMLRYKNNKHLIIYSSMKERNDWMRYFLCIGVYQIRKTLDPTMQRFLAENNLSELENGMRNYPYMTEEEIMILEDKIKGKKNTGMGLFKKKQRSTSWVPEKGVSPLPAEIFISEKDNPIEDNIHDSKNSSDSGGTSPVFVNSDRTDFENEIEENSFQPSLPQLNKPVSDPSSSSKPHFHPTTVTIPGKIKHKKYAKEEEEEAKNIPKLKSDKESHKSSDLSLKTDSIYDLSNTDKSYDLDSSTDSDVQSYSISSLKATIEIFEKMSNSEYIKTPVRFSVESITKGARITEQVLKDENDVAKDEEEWSESNSASISFDTGNEGNDQSLGEDYSNSIELVDYWPKSRDTNTVKMTSIEENAETSNQSTLMKHENETSQITKTANIEKNMPESRDIPSSKSKTVGCNTLDQIQNKTRNSMDYYPYKPKESISFSMTSQEHLRSRRSAKSDPKDSAIAKNEIPDSLVSQIRSQLIQNYASTENTNAYQVKKAITPTKASTIGQRLMQLQQCLNERSGSGTSVNLQVRIGKKDVSIMELPETRQ